HGDAGGDDELAKHVSSAYNVLANASRRATYDRTMGPRSPDTASEPPAAARRRVFHPEHGTRSASMLDVDPSQWGWYVPAQEAEAQANVKAPRRRHVGTMLLVVAFAAWAAAGAAAATTLGMPLARIEAVSTPAAL